VAISVGFKLVVLVLAVAATVFALVTNLPNCANDELLNTNTAKNTNAIFIFLKFIFFFYGNEFWIIFLF
jgi:hypothetical protein